MCNFDRDFFNNNPHQNKKNQKENQKNQLWQTSTHKSYSGRLLPPLVIMMEVRKTSPTCVWICSFTSYASISDKGKIIAILSCLTKGDATFWVQAKKEDVIKGTLESWQI